MARKEDGGLGIKKIQNMKMTMMAKMGWRLVMEKYKLWTKSSQLSMLRGALTMQR